MKVCPKCKRDYLDDGLRYCLDDGVLLVTKTPSGLRTFSPRCACRTRPHRGQSLPPLFRASIRNPARAGSSGRWLYCHAAQRRRLVPLKSVVSSI